MPEITVQTKLPVTLKTFQTPNFALYQPARKRNERGYEEGDAPEAIAIPLSELDPETLSMLCDEFRKEVFKKAGKRIPPTITPA